MNSVSHPVLPAHGDVKYAEALYRLRHLLREYDSSSQAGSEVGTGQYQHQQQQQQQQQEQRQQHHRQWQQKRRQEEKGYQQQRQLQQQQQSWQSQNPEVSRTPMTAAQITADFFSASVRQIPPQTRGGPWVLPSPHHPPPSIHVHPPELPPMIELPPGFQLTPQPLPLRPPPSPRSYPSLPPQQLQQQQRMETMTERLPPVQRTSAVSQTSPIALPRQRKREDEEGAEAGTSTTELATMDRAKARQLGQLAWRQEELVGQLEHENMLLRNMMDEMEQHVQELVAENRSLTDQLRTPAELSASFGVSNSAAQPSTTASAGPQTSPSDGGPTPAPAPAPVPDPTSRAQHKEQEAGNNESAKPTKPMESMKPTEPTGPVEPAEPARRTELEPSDRERAELSRLREQVEEHQRWLEGGYQQQQRRQKLEKQELTQALGQLQTRLTELQSREEESLKKVTESLRVAQQAQLEKAEAQNTADTLRRDLESQQERQELQAQEQERRLASVRQEAESSVEASFGRLRRQLTEQTEKLAQLEADRQRGQKLEQELRTAAEARRQEAQDAKLEAERALSRHHQELSREQQRRLNAESRLEAVGAEAERTERDTRHETERQRAEIVSVRKQLSSAETSLNAAHRDRVNLQERVNQLERQWSGEIQDTEAARRTLSEDVRCLTERADSREQQLLDALQKTREDADIRVAQLEDMLEQQAALSAQLQTECAALAAELTASQQRQQELRVSSERLQQRLDETEAARRRLEARSYQYGRRHEALLLRAEETQRRLDSSEAAAAQLAQQHQQLLQEKRLLRDRLTLAETVT